MNIQTHFNNKKYFLASFFSQLQQAIRELSIAVQLEIDQQYLAAKQLLSGLTAEQVENECNNMKSHEPQFLAKIIDMICEHAKIYCNNMKQIPPPMYIVVNKPHKSTPKDQTPQSSGMRINKIEATIAKNQDQEKSKHIQASKEFSSGNFSHIQSYKQVTAFSPARQAITNTKQPHARISLASQTPNSNLEKMYEPINLLNKLEKVRSSSTSKIASSGSRSSEASKSLNKDNHRSNNVYLSQENHQQIAHQLNKQLFQKSRPKQNRIILQNPNQISKSYLRVQSIEQNQILCEKLDHRIHEQALEILHKVKLKRSPYRKEKNCESNTHRPLKSDTSVPVLDISKDTIPIWRGSRAN